MPSNVAIAGQVTPTGQASSTQSSFRQMVGEVRSWSPDCPAQMVKKWVNNSYRRVVDYRLWYGLLCRGQCTVPSVYSTGTATFTLGSPVVNGVGTAWTQAMINEQIRAGFSTGWYNIQSVQGATQLTLDLPWGNPTVNSVGYQIVQTWVSLGPNVKRVLEMVNQRQGWRMVFDLPQAVGNYGDTWRTTTGWSWALLSKEPRADGSPQWEIYPAPTFQQVFPFLAYVQPPDMSLDGDFPVTFVRSDIIVLGALKQALLYRGKASRYYDPQTAAVKEQEFKEELEKMALNDDNQYPKSVLYDWNKMFGSFGFGSTYAQSHDSGPGDW